MPSTKRTSSDLEVSVGFNPEKLCSHPQPVDPLGQGQSRVYQTSALNVRIDLLNDLHELPIKLPFSNDPWQIN